MEVKTKEKKRSASFRKLFTGKIFSKDKKKVDEQQGNKVPCKENVAYSDNIKNESVFHRQSPCRHTIGGNSLNKETKLYRNDSQRSTQKPLDMKEIDQRYAQMHIREFQGIKRSFENQNAHKDDHYINMNRPPIKFIDTSSSFSTLTSERHKIYQNEVLTNKQYLHQREVNDKGETMPNMGVSKIAESTRKSNKATPPRAQELRQDFRLVSPKALSPVRLECQTGNSQEEHSSKPKTTYSPQLRNTGDFEDDYSRVFNSMERPKLSLQRSSSFRSTTRSVDTPRLHKSPSLESTKLKLPTNREIVPLSPRMKSPIPKDRVSTEKIIATELLKPIRSPSPTRSNTVIIGDDLNYNQNNKNVERDSTIIMKPPIARKSIEQMQNPPVSEQNYSVVAPETEDETFTPTPTNQIIQSPSPIRPPSARSVTPVEMRTPSSNTSQSPQKEDIRRSVEAYYWKEIKKLKEQEDQDIYYYQTQMMPYGYVDDSMNSRRSRSISPSIQRNSRRSLSLPRDPRSSNVYGRIQPKLIPEDSTIRSQQKIHHENYNIQQNFLRKVPERQSGGTVPRNHYSTSSLYRPIFKRGSLTAPIKELDDQQNKKVTFNSRSDLQRDQTWPNRNSFTQSPPQINANNISDDDVFFPPTKSQTTKLLINGKEVYGYTNIPQQLPVGPRINNEYSPHQNLYGYTPQHAHREPLYGPLVVANVRQNEATSKESPYGPLIIKNHQVHRVNVPGNFQDESVYNQPIDAVRPYPLIRHNSVQLPENVYGHEKQQASRNLNDQMPVCNEQLQNRNPNHHMQRREIIMTDEIYGQFGRYIPLKNNVQYVNIMQQNNAESPYGRTLLEPPSYGFTVGNNNVESPYGYGRTAPRQITVRNKVCDIYGQIHDTSLTPTHQKSGVVLGQLQRPSHIIRQSCSQLPNENFTRNSRLTASANDMYRRNHIDPQSPSEKIYQRSQRPIPNQGAPTRPLPPVPTKSSRTIDQPKIKNDLNDSTKQQPKKEKKKRSFFRKS